MGGLPAHRRSPTAQTRNHRPQTRTEARPQTLRRKITAQQILPRHDPKSPQGMARAMDLRSRPRRTADQQPRRALATRCRHLSQAQPRQPVRRWRDAHRPAALRTHDLPPPTPLAVRLPHRSTQRQRPRPPSPAPELNSQRTERVLKSPDLQGFSNAPEWTRTTTENNLHKALNLARLPIPPRAPGAASIASPFLPRRSQTIETPCGAMRKRKLAQRPGHTVACIRPRAALLYEHMFVQSFRPATQGAVNPWI